MGTLYEIFLRMRNVSEKSNRENKTTHIIFNRLLFFQKSFRLWDNVDKYCRAGEATDDKTVHVLCVLHNQEYRNAHTECYIYCFLM